MLPHTGAHIIAPMGADIVFPVGALQEVDPELHRPTLALILSEVEGSGAGLGRLRFFARSSFDFAQDESGDCG